MQIQRVSFAAPMQTTNVSRKSDYNYHKDLTGTDSFNPSFTSYGSILKKFVNTNIKTEDYVEKSFIDLISTVSGAEHISINPSFAPILETFSKKGFRGLLREMWIANPSKEFEQFINNDGYNNIHLITETGQSLLKIISFGKFGYSKTSPNDVRLIFSNQAQTASIEYTMTKKGELQICQSTIGRKSIISQFYPETGNLKKTIFEYYGTNPETKYYKKDGSTNFLKTLFFGGPAISNI